MFREIPARFREGVDGVVVRRATVPHPEIPEVFTLGECRTTDWPSPYGGPGEPHSSVVLYYGSFAALAERDPEFDWEAELWETLTHELRHHLESRADEDALERLDYAEDQNYLRAAGEPFDPEFYRYGDRVGRRTYRVGDDLFVETPWSVEAAARGRARVVWRGAEREIVVPGPAARFTFVRLGRDPAGGGDVYAVLVLRRGLWAAWRDRWRRRHWPAIAEYDLGEEDERPGPADREGR
jgi:hypothetical protein